MTTLITGATGLIGRDLLNLLYGNGQLENQNFRLFVRETSDVTNLKKMGFELFYGDIDNKDSLLKATKDVDVIIHIVQMRYSPKVVDVANENNVKRIIIIGTTGVFSKYKMYSEEYKECEEYIKSHSKVPYVILRPTMIYGSKKDKNVHKLVEFMNKYRFFPVFGDGKGKMQPIYYQDLSNAIYSVYNDQSIVNNAFNLAGKNQLKYEDLLIVTANQLKKKVLIIKIPLPISILLVSIYNKLSKKPKLKLEQVKRISEDKIFDYSNAETQFNFSPISFEEGIKKQIHSMY
ncbi:NAD(P)H-binding protein [Halobacillus salinarum]|uniref:NAD(P)H-binding protein n=1 Tax=Halobacillus salinarum TaxID=2932257 RepID=A0ABY4ELS1_9BACI|nr:NAD(P)H-binding protein [Halobacillus salinarum]UOQ45398.1 NAD(P)H-binding protein [Halobacillus salinarum]